MSLESRWVDALDAYREEFGVEFPTEMAPDSSEEQIAEIEKCLASERPYDSGWPWKKHSPGMILPMT